MRKIRIIILAILVILCGTTIVNAEESATATLIPSNTTVAAGDTFTVKLAVNWEDGIEGVDTTINYDLDKLELVSGAVVDSANWSSFGEGATVNVIPNSTTTITSADIYLITFKVKANVVNADTTTIRTAEITVDSLNDTTNIASVSTTVSFTSNNTATEPTSDTNSVVVNTTEPTSDTNAVGVNATEPATNITTNTTSTTTKDNSTAKTSIPKTGIVMYVVPVMIAIALVSIGIINYNKYKNV